MKAIALPLLVSLSAPAIADDLHDLVSAGAPWSPVPVSDEAAAIIDAGLRKRMASPSDPLRLSRMGAARSDAVPSLVLVCGATETGWPFAGLLHSTTFEPIAAATDARTARNITLACAEASAL